MDEVAPTTFPDLNAGLQELIIGLNMLLANIFLGAYLQGSYAVGISRFLTLIQPGLSTWMVLTFQRMC